MTHNTNLEKKKIRQLAKFLINPSSRSIQPVKVSRSLWIIKNSFNRSGSNFPDTLLKLEDIEFYDRGNVDVEVVPGGEKSSMPENWNLILNTVQNSARLLLKKERKKGRKKSRRVTFFHGGCFEYSGWKIRNENRKVGELKRNREVAFPRKVATFLTGFGRYVFRNIEIDPIFGTQGEMEERLYWRNRFVSTA